MKKVLLKLGIIFSAVFLPLTAFNQALQAGDMAILAYQTSVTSQNDQVAFVTFVNIPQGTEINFTDSKFTTNTPAMCPKSLKWTAPSGGISAGTVITFKTDLVPLAVNVGTLTGVGGMTDFGLSSGGDQVIVYTGDNTNPTFITAFSSNVWAATNTSCTGSNSLRPTGLDGTNSVSLSSATGNSSGVAVNAFYNGTLSGTPSQLKTAIFNPSNWTAGAAGAAQTWPTWNIVLGLLETKHSVSTLSLYPNPVKEGNAIHFNEEVAGEILDFSGKVLMTFSNQNEVSVQGLNKGIYIIRTDAGAAGKFIIE